ncbi:DNA-binding protein WhiA [Desulfohalotomaculum tongense]|uniref:DNA-binding protein WhiA n=1 Tax=Desulforadius tongensis TaxID=1216062 RepID=UPI001958C715|nr:DNA-binding protein WhiA [Desulforadius tongensis]MBM7853645.1 DNA-binding protein WhiA [Desulforadius tongensis]
MSFSVVTKDELARIIGPRQCCRLSELAALIKMDGSIQIAGQKLAISVVTENAAVARKVLTLFKTLFGLQSEVMVQRKVRLKKNNVYLVRIPPQPEVEKILVKLGMWNEQDRLPTTRIKAGMLARECCRRAYLRGVFLGGGSVSNPEGTYHLEIISTDGHHAQEIVQLMKKMGLEAKISTRKNWHVVYLKESDQIVECLSLMGAHTALLNYENVRIYKGMRNKVNRLVNCETANLNKTINAAMRQQENIKYIARTIGLDKLPPALRETAELRIAHPDISLKELGELMQPPVGKSGINHRMRKIDKIANQLRRKGLR